MVEIDILGENSIFCRELSHAYYHLIGGRGERKHQDRFNNESVD